MILHLPILYLQLQAIEYVEPISKLQSWTASLWSYRPDYLIFHRFRHSLHEPTAMEYDFETGSSFPIKRLRSDWINHNSSFRR